MIEIVSCMEYLEVKQDHFLFEYGDVGVHFYVLLEGKVEIQIPDKN